MEIFMLIYTESKSTQPHLCTLLLNRNILCHFNYLQLSAPLIVWAETVKFPLDEKQKKILLNSKF